MVVRSGIQQRYPRLPWAGDHLIFVRDVHETFGAEDLEVANRCVASVELAVWSERMMFGVSSRDAVENIARASTGFFPVVLG